MNTNKSYNEEIVDRVKQYVQDGKRLAVELIMNDIVDMGNDYLEDPIDALTFEDYINSFASYKLARLISDELGIDYTDAVYGDLEILAYIQSINAQRAATDASKMEKYIIEEYDGFLHEPQEIIDVIMQLADDGILEINTDKL